MGLVAGGRLIPPARVAAHVKKPPRITTMSPTPIRLRVAEVVEKRRFCARCEASITSTDKAVGECTQCRAMITTKGSEDDDNDNGADSLRGRTMTTEIHDTHTCPCEMCVWARETAANKPKSPSESPETLRKDAGFLVPEAKNVPTGLETPRIDPYEYLGTFKYAPSDAESEQPVEITAPTFTEEWDSAPRAMIGYVEQSIAEYWFLRGVRAGETAATIVINSDLKELRRIAAERIEQR